MNAFAAQPGGPSFAVLGGNAVGPINSTADGNGWQEGNGAADFAALPGILSNLNLPLFAAYGNLDAVPGYDPESQPWADAFSGAPAPFGGGGTVAGITPVSYGAATPGSVSRYYSFDAAQNGGTLRVIVLDNSAGSLDDGQAQWLSDQLAAAANKPTVVVAALPLYGNATSDGPDVAAQLAAAGVIAVFTGPVHGEQNELHQVPDGGSVTIPEYEGATLGYQQANNDGVVWYDASVDTRHRKVSVDAVPLVQSLALEPLRGLNVGQSLTLAFQAIGRRPQGSLATAPQTGDTFAGYDNYVEIPASGCGTCITPSYTFSSSNPDVGNFVTPSGPGSPLPAYGDDSKPITNAKSGLFCAYSPGSTVVTVTAGLLSASYTVNVTSEGIGAPCNLVPYNTVNEVTPSATPVVSAGAPAAATPPPPPAGAATVIAASAPPPPLAPPPPAVAAPHAPLPSPTPLAVAPLVPSSSVFAQPAAILPPPPITAQPIPPGGATAPSVSQQPASAQRREKARKHATQSAFTLLPPAGTQTAADWWYEGAVGVGAVLAALLFAQTLRPRRANLRRSVPAPSYARTRRR
jgi:hypothetical protein